MSEVSPEVYTESAMRDRLVNVIQNDKEKIEVLKHVKPASTIQININSAEFVDYYLSDSVKFKQEYRNAVMYILHDFYPDLDINYTFGSLNIEFTTDAVILLHDINPTDHENSPISFNCEVIACDSWKTYIKKAKGICPKCSNTYEIKCDFDRLLPITLCKNVSCRMCKVDIDRKTIETGYVQTLVIQEPLDEARFHNPISFEAKIYDSSVGSASPSQKKLMTGIFHSKLGKDNENDIYIEIISMIDKESTDILIPSNEEIDKYKHDSKLNGFTKKLIGSFAPMIYSNELYENIKLAIMLQLVGGKRGKKRGDINSILVGDPSMAKSVLLQFAKSVTQKSIYTSGKGSTTAGLTIGIVKLDSGRSVAMAGVLPICNNGFAMIDEFDKMSTNDRSGIHEAMEQQTTSIAKAGIIMTLPTKTSILAAANPIGGKYDSELSLTQNINLPPTILSRFDLIWLITDTYSREYDELKANHIINDFFDESVNQSDIYLTVEKMTAYLNYARKLDPVITPELRKEILKMYSSLRYAGSKNEGLAIGTRQLEGIMRLAFAHAKLLLKDQVDVSDLEVVTKLLKSSYMTLKVDLDKGDSYHKQFVTKEDSKQTACYKIMALCTASDGIFTSGDFIKKAVESGKFSENEAKMMLVTMHKEGEILEQGNRRWKKAYGIL